MKTSLLLLVTGILAAPRTPAQSGTLDESFGIDGVVNYTTAGQHYFGETMVVRPNGNILIAGARTEGPTLTDDRFGYVEMEPNGDLIGAYDHGLSDMEQRAMDMALQPDGRCVLVGYSNPASDELTTRIMLMRTNQNGTLDGTFGTNGIVETELDGSVGTANSVVVLPGGGVLVAGTRDDDPILLRYTSDGTLDLDFGDNGIVSGPSGPSNDHSLVLAPGGKVVWTFASFEMPFVLRLSTDGVLDPTFDGDGVLEPVVDAVLAFSIHASITETGGVVVGISSDLMEIHRYLNNGEPDASFGEQGRVVTAIAPNPAVTQRIRVAALPDGKVAWASTVTGNFFISRLLANGAADPLFGTNGFTYRSTVGGRFGALWVQSDGNLLVGGRDYPGSVITGPGGYVVFRYLNEISVGVADLPSAQVLPRLYPNPAGSQAGIDFNLSRPTNISIEVTNTVGQAVRTYHLGMLPAGDRTEVLNLEGLESGAYGIVVMNGHERYATHLVKY